MPRNASFSGAIDVIPFEFRSLRDFRACFELGRLKKEDI